MAPDKDQIRAMFQKNNESFKEYTQGWNKVVAYIYPPLEEKEMTKIFLKTLSYFNKLGFRNKARLVAQGYTQI